MDDSLVDTIEFRVIGELKGDPGHLLLVGDDGRWYGYDHRPRHVRDDRAERRLGR